MFKLILVLFSVFYGYAILRYHIGKGLGFEESIFILNKAFAWMSFTLIALTVLKQSTLDKLNLQRRSLGNTGFLLALTHIIFAILLFSDEHYPKFYLENEISFQGWLIIGIGAISILIYTALFRTSILKKSNDSRIFRLGKYTIVINALHPLLIGFQGWFSPNDWPFYLPPITMLSVLFLIFILALRGVGK